MTDLIVAILRVTFFVCGILIQILVIPATIWFYNEEWKKGRKIIPVLWAFIILLLVIPVINVDLFLLDILTGERPISAIWEIK